MPLRDYKGYLSDVVEACDRITEYSQGLTLEDYGREGMKRDAIERRLVIIGEALAQARQHYPQVNDDISYVREIIGLGNRLIHAYLHTLNSTVWNIIEEFIPILRHEASMLLQQMKE